MGRGGVMEEKEREREKCVCVTTERREGTSESG